MLRFFSDISAQRKITPAILAATLNGSDAGTVHLNSERIEQRFGSYGIDVLGSDTNLRRANLYSVEHGINICRTNAVVQFNEELDTRYATEHEQVLSGGSLGAIFKARGWSIRKETLYIGSLDLSNCESRLAGLMHLADRRSPALHVYQLLVAKDGHAFEYATVAEAHHPDYLTTAELNEIFPYDDSQALQPRTLSDLASLFDDSQPH